MEQLLPTETITSLLPAALHLSILGGKIACSPKVGVKKKKEKKVWRWFCSETFSSTGSVPVWRVEVLAVCLCAACVPVFSGAAKGTVLKVLRNSG